MPASARFIRIGTDGPKTSASSKPTRRFSARAVAHARFTAVVDLPTPPLPDATAMIRWTPRRLSGTGGCLNPPGGGGVPGPGTLGADANALRAANDARRLADTISRV